jgi:hypothetical protein
LETDSLAWKQKARHSNGAITHMAPSTKIHAVFLIMAKRIELTIDRYFFA